MTPKAKRSLFTAALLGGIFLIICGSELILRYKFGFCDAPLSIESDRYEYIFAPNQNRHRFGNHIIYNSYSQRSQEPDSNKTIVLGLGDSVINGGVQTDHDDLATTIASNDTLQILNISAGSWGPDNCAAYLKEKGTFGASAILLVVSSHDAHDIINFQPVVGTPNFPDKQYSSAIIELIHRYILPRIFKQNNTIDPDKAVESQVGTNIRKGDGIFNPGFDQLLSIADSLRIPMHIYLHPDRAEFAEGKFNSQGQEIIAWAKERNIPLATGFQLGETDATYRDGIHLNAQGQKILARWMQQATAGLHR